MAELPAAWHGLGHAVRAAQGFSQSDQWASVAIYENLLAQELSPPQPAAAGPPATYDAIESAEMGKNRDTTLFRLR